MSAGVDYGTYTVLESYPCDIKSIVRFRGGFNVKESSVTTYAKCVFPPFTPIYINLTTREVSFAEDVQYGSDTEDVIQSFTYNKIVMEEGVTVTAILSAQEISLTQLEALRYVDASGAEQSFTVYAGLTTGAWARTTIRTNHPGSSFVW